MTMKTTNAIAIVLRSTGGGGGGGAAFNPLYATLLLVVFVVVVCDGSPGFRSGGFPKFPEATSCGRRSIPWSPNRDPRIVGGAVPPVGAYPWQVDIRRRSAHLCGGALLSPRLVITAAHCLGTEGASQLRAAVGAHGPNQDDQEQVVRVQEAVIHPDFRKLGPYSHDIALLLLASPIVTNQYRFPVCLPSSSPPPGAWCTVAGWGALDPADPERISPVLRAALVPVISLDSCRRPAIYGGRQQAILDTMLCAGRLRGGVDACGGDSGGPLTCEVEGKHVVAGLVSWGDGCAKPNRPGVYTRVTAYLDWIQTTARQLGVDIS